jgi:NodT family efflux transporter outer membrane factor (OMF) lipoprotein
MKKADERMMRKGAEIFPRESWNRAMYRKLQVVAMVAAVSVMGGCIVGPKYHTPPVDTPTAYKELTPADFKNTDGWKVAEPQDARLHGDWWRIFNDPELNTLEDQVNISNQTIAGAFENYLEARAVVKEARAQYFPTLSVTPGATVSRGLVAEPTTSSMGVVSTVNQGKIFQEYTLPFDATWVPDLWGRVHNTVRTNVAAAQVSAADLENTRLTAQSELAVDYFDLRGQDALKELLDSTVKAYEEYLNLTKVLFETGIDSQESVAQAQTQLQTTQAEDTNLDIARAQYEHAIALLIGKPASTFSLPLAPLKHTPPAIPLGVPSQLLERRPDIAAAERGMEEQNALIGVAKAAYYPTLTLSGDAGYSAANIGHLFSYPDLFWSLGSSLAQTIYEGGLRRATMQQYQATYESAVANYRQTVLTAFQQVEDNLAALRILSVELKQEDAAVASANQYLTLATDRYRLGIDPYLDVITAQTSLLTNQQTAVNLQIQQMTDSVQLIEALGGGWDKAQLPTGAAIIYSPLNPAGGNPYPSNQAPTNAPAANPALPGNAAHPANPEPGNPAPANPGTVSPEPEQFPPMPQ